MPTPADDWGDPCPRCGELVFRLVPCPAKGAWKDRKVCTKCNGKMVKQEATKEERRQQVNQWRQVLRGRRGK